MKKIKLHKSEGYHFINKKNQGLFITHKKGVYKKDDETEIPYHKVRLTQIYKQKKGDNISMTLQRPARFVSFDPDMLKNLAELLGAIHEEIYGKPLYGGEIKEVKPDEPVDEVDELMAKLGMKGRK